MIGCEKAYGDPDCRRRWGYALLGELYIPDRLRAWHLIKELRRLGYWHRAPVALLDASGGKGAFAYYCARHFPQWQVVVVDDEIDAIARGQQIKHRLRLQNLELCFDNIVDYHGRKLYDVIVCSDILERIVCDDIAVQNLARMVKPGGVLILTSPSIPQRKHLTRVVWREQRTGFHPSRDGQMRDGYSAKDMRQLLSHAGLEVEALRWTFGRFGSFMFDLFCVTGDRQSHPLVYMLLFPLYIGLSYLDTILPNRRGSGILAVGRKP